MAAVKEGCPRCLRIKQRRERRLEQENLLSDCCSSEGADDDDDASADNVSRKTVRSQRKSPPQ